MKRFPQWTVVRQVCFLLLQLSVKGFDWAVPPTFVCESSADFDRVLLDWHFLTLLAKEPAMDD